MKDRVEEYQVFLEVLGPGVKLSSELPPDTRSTEVPLDFSARGAGDCSRRSG